MTIASINPATGETLRTFEPLGAAELDACLTRAADAFTHWSRAPLAERLRVVAEAGRLLDARKAEYGRLMTLEMGKPFGAAIEEAAKCALACRYYAEHTARFLAPEVVLDERDAHGEVWYRPLGVVLAVMPWNFPFWQVIRFAAPALAAGNVGLLKHASNVPQCALALDTLFRDAGAPEGAFQTLLVGSDRVAGIIADRRVAAVTLTGSTPAGRSVASAAGQHLKKTVLELGGSDPFIVMPSADVAAAAKTAVTARTINNGQSCIAAKRFIVAKAVAEEFTRRFVDGMQALVVGDPMRDDTHIGPLATAGIARDLQRQVDETVARGARVLLGGQRRDGNYFDPTVLTDIPPGSPAYDDELFGPVASLFVVDDADAAIRLANATSFGLAAAIWTRDDAEAQHFARELEAGTVFINGMVASDPRFPFGGVKASGYGRELGRWGMHEFLNTKAVRRSGAVSKDSSTE
jgi:succinate-semialdehyde dehydrogenase / glutarate-semialdehyde dehydrogenase